MARLLVSLISLLSAVAVLFCATVAVLWGRSYFAADLAVFTGGHHTVSAHSASGGIIVVHTSQKARLPASFEWAPQRDSFPGAAGRLGALFTFDARGMDDVWALGAGADKLVAFPHWAVCVAGLLPAAWLEARRRRRRRLNTSHCVKCGYLLRGNQGMCPQCRTPAGGFVQ